MTTVAAPAREGVRTILDRALDDDLRAACDELVPPGNAVADFHNSSTWMKPVAFD